MVLRYIVVKVNISKDKYIQMNFVQQHNYFTYSELRDLSPANAPGAIR